MVVYFSLDQGRAGKACALSFSLARNWSSKTHKYYNKRSSSGSIERQAKYDKTRKYHSLETDKKK